MGFGYSESLLEDVLVPLTPLLLSFLDICNPLHALAFKPFLLKVGYLKKKYSAKISTLKVLTSHKFWKMLYFNLCLRRCSVNSVN